MEQLPDVAHERSVDSGDQLCPRSRHPVAHGRSVLVEQVLVSTPLDPFLSLKALSSYSGLSVRKLREFLADLEHPLPHYRVGGKIIVRRSEFDTLMARFRRAGDPDLERIVADTLRSLR